MRKALFLSYLLLIAFSCYFTSVLSMSRSELSGNARQRPIEFSPLQPGREIAYPPINPLGGMPRLISRPEIVQVPSAEEQARKRLLARKELEEQARKRRREEKQPEEETAETSSQQPERRSAFRPIAPGTWQISSGQVGSPLMFERLPAEMQQHILSFAGPEIRTSRLVSQSMRAQADSMLPAMTIPLHQFNARTLGGPYPHVKRLKLVRTPLRNNTVTLSTILLIPELFPNLTHLDISGTNPAPRAFTLLCNLQTFKDLTHLSISNNGSYVDDYVVGQLSRAAFSPNLRSLNLSNNNISQAGMRALAAQQTLTSLTELNVSLNDIHADGFNALLNAVFMPNLEVLDISSTALMADDGQPDFEQFIQRCTRLRELTLSNNFIGNERVLMLTRASFAHSLEVLRLQNTRITAAAFERNRERDVFPRLRELDLGLNSDLGNTGVLRILDNIFMRHVETLDLTATGIDGHVVQELSRQENGLSALRALLIGHNRLIGDAGFEHLITAPFAQFLRELAVPNANITRESARRLADTQAFPSLRQLDIFDNALGNQGFVYLTQAAFAPLIEGLNVGRNNVASAAFEPLENLNKFKRLVRLSLAGNPLTAQAIELLSRADFARQLNYLDLSSLLMTDLALEILARPGAFVSLEQLDISNNRLVSHEGFVLLAQAPFAHNLRALNIAYTFLLDGLLKWEKKEFVLENFPRLRWYGRLMLFARVA